MIRVSAVSEFERFTLVDKNGVERILKMFVKNYENKENAAKYKAQKSQEWLDMVAEMPKINFDVDNEPANKSE